MNLNNLKANMEFKNYKDICIFLDEKVKGGESKKHQLKEWKRYFDFHKNGNKIMIDKVYDTPLKKEDGRMCGNNRTQKHLKGFDIPWDDRNKVGVYIIKKDDTVYVGSTCVSFRNRFIQHYSNATNKMNHTKNLLNDGGKFKILYDMTHIQDKELIRMVEDYFIKYFISNKSYNCINVINGSWKNKKEKMLNIKIKESKYLEAIQLLINNGLLDIELEDIIIKSNRYLRD